MISITLSLPMTLICCTLLIAIFSLGFFSRSYIQRKLKSRVLELENEMVNNHAEILQLTQVISRLQSLGNANTPVIALGNAKEFNQKTAAK